MRFLFILRESLENVWFGKGNFRDMVHKYMKGCGKTSVNKRISFFQLKVKLEDDFHWH